MSERAPALDEQETNFTIEATDRNTLYVWSNDSVWLARLEKLGIKPTRESEYGKSYKLDLNEFTFTLRPKRKLTDEQRAAAREQLASLRKG
ncbi:MAG: hypothetical protein KDD28_18215 [Phaeodactylibacter sp.]|nr:hypothetical protein [Phaeodactylibacter sp.]